MSETKNNWKRWVRWGLIGLLVVDGALLIAAWRMGREQNRAEALENLRAEHKLLADDIGRARSIRERLPEVRLQCQQFYADYLRVSDGGYSAIAADLGSISEKQGLRVSSISYKQRVVEQHGVVQVDVSATVEGDYAKLVHFINGLEKSKNFFLIYDLTMAPTTSGLKLNLELRTYFRS